MKILKTQKLIIMNLISICEKLFKKNSKNKHYILIFILLVVALFPIAQTYAEQSRTGVMIPLYSYPSQEWKKIVDAKTLHPNVPIVAVINPNNGPGTSKDTNFDAGINQLKSSGVIVLGYTHTDYATRDMNLVIADINSYKNWYNLDGIKFDEMTHTEGNESYYANLNSYVKSLGYTLTAGNPGTDISQSYVGIVDTLTIFENSSLPKLSNLGGWHTFYDKRNFSVVSYGINIWDDTVVLSMARYVGYIYITDDNKPNPYDTVSSSFVDLVALLDTCPESPISGDWTISSNCSLTTNTIAPGNITVQNGAVLTIPSGKSLNIDFSHHKLLIKAGSGVLIKSGGRISGVP